MNIRHGVQVKLDLFHAIQRVVRTVSQKNKYYSSFVREFRQVFCASGDVGERRLCATPEAKEISNNFDRFLARWEKK